MAAIPSLNAVFVTALVLILLVWARRVFLVYGYRKNHPPLLPLSSSPSNGPKVSVIVPAKNEEKNIVNCLDSLVRQNYKNLEIIVVDDRSDDSTPQILEDYSVKIKIPFKVVRIEKLPPGWTGKNHAMMAGSRAARGEWLLFTDADTTHSRESVSTSLECAIERNIDFLTLAPEAECRTFWEKTVQPLAVGSLAIWFEPKKINDSKSAVVLANGQFILIKKTVYEKVGGNESVKDLVVEDVELARKVRQAGFLVQFLNGTLLYSTRMYSSLKEIRTGWTRIFIHLFNRSVPALLHKIFLFVFFSSLPFFILFFEIFARLTAYQGYSYEILFLAAVTCSFIVFVRFIGNKAVKADPWYGFLHLLGSLVMIWILAQCVARILLNRPSMWRGQAYR